MYGDIDTYMVADIGGIMVLAGRPNVDLAYDLYKLCSLVVS